jgi:hypothetical protein
MYMSKFYLKDIIEAQNWNIIDLAIESGLSIDWLENFLDETTISLIGKEEDEKLCKATNQQIGYFFEIDKKFKIFSKE